MAACLVGALQARTFTELSPPCPRTGPCPGDGGGEFGLRELVLDFDGDGFPDLVVSALGDLRADGCAGRVLVLSM